jgi:hypothetical protein
MNIRNVRDALKVYVGESKESERQTCVKPGIFCVTFSGWSAGEAQQHKYTLKQITGFLWRSRNLNPFLHRTFCVQLQTHQFIYMTHLPAKVLSNEKRGDQYCLTVEIDSRIFDAHLMACASVTRFLSADHSGTASLSLPIGHSLDRVSILSDMNNCVSM